MGQNELEVVVALMAFFGSGVFLLIGLKMFLNHRARRLASGGGDVHQLTEAVDELRRDVTDTRVELADVQERLDFAERLLTKARDEGRLNPGG